MLGYSYDADELLQVITKLEVDKDILTTRKTLRRILVTSNGGKNLEQLFPAVIKHLSSSDLLTKKLVCWFIRDNGQNQEFILLAINTLVKDCSDPNPLIRGFSLKTLTSIPHSFVLDHSLPLVRKGLEDSSVYVRRAAVLSCVSLYGVNSELLLENGIVDKLYNAIRDSDSVVVVNSLLALDEILGTEGGVVINHNIAVYLLNKLQMFTDYQLSLLMTFLTKYVPSNNQETLDIMNVIDPYLKSGSVLLLVQTLKYFHKLVEGNFDVKKLATIRAKDQFLHLLTADNPEMTLVLLEFIETLLPEFLELFQTHHRLFYCRYNEPLYLKVKKILLLSSLTTDANFSEVVEELGMYCLDTVLNIARCAVNAMRSISSKFPQRASQVVDMLVNLLDVQGIGIVADVLNALQGLDLKVVSDLPDVLLRLEKCADAIDSDEAKPALLWLLGEYGEALDSSPYLLEGYADELNAHSDPLLCESLLTSAVKLFAKRPAECQEMLGKVLEKCSNFDDADILYRATFYFRLLEKSSPDCIRAFFP